MQATRMGETEKVYLSLKVIQAFYVMLKCGDVHTSSSQEVPTVLKNTIIYEVFDPVSNGIGHRKMEKYLVTVWSDMTYLVRGKKFATIEVCVSSAVKAQGYSDKTMKTKEVVLLSP